MCVYTCIYIALKISGNMYKKLLRMVICKMRREYGERERVLTLYDPIHLGRKIYTLYTCTHIALKISKSIHNINNDQHRVREEWRKRDLTHTVHISVLFELFITNIHCFDNSKNNFFSIKITKHSNTIYGNTLSKGNQDYVSETFTDDHIL